MTQGWKLQDSIELAKDGLYLRIGKGTLYDGVSKSDRSIVPLKQLGYRATGKQPDIYLKFPRYRILRI